MASIWKTKHSVALMAAGCGAAVPFFAPVVMASEDKSSGHVKPSQLPIYDNPEDLFDISYEVSGKGQLQEGVEVVRKELCGAVGATKEFRDECTCIYETGKAHTAGQIAYLREDENVAARSGAIAVGGVLGLMLGARGRFFKKLLYTSAGAAGTAAVLYPQYSKQYTQEALDVANSYTTVAYNFLVGVKPQTAKEESESTSSAAAAASALKAGCKVEVSNPYPSLLTLPHSRLFTKKAEKNYWPYVKVVKEGPVITQEKSLEQIAEEASQVSTLGFRLQDRESNPVDGFGSVLDPVVSDEDKSVSNNEEGGGVSSVTTKEEEDIEIKSQFQEHGSILPSNSEGVEGKSGEKLIDKLIGATKEVIDVASEVEKDAKLVEEVCEQVEKVSEIIPVIGEKIESAAEFVKDASTVVEEIADEVKEVAEKIEVFEAAEAQRESKSSSQLVAAATQEENKEKTSIFKKVSNFFSSSSDATESASANLKVPSSVTSDSLLKTEPSSSLGADEKQEKSVSDKNIPGSNELFVIEPMPESDAAFKKGPETSPSEAKIIGTTEKSASDSPVETLPQKSPDTILVNNESAFRNREEMEGRPSQSSLVQDDSKTNSNSNLPAQEATKSQESVKPTSSEVADDVKSEERPSFFNKIADFFSTDTSSTETASSKSDLNNNIAARIEKLADKASNSGTDASKTETLKSTLPDVSVVQKPEIPDSLLKAKDAATPKQDETSSSLDKSRPVGKDKEKPQVSDYTKSSQEEQTKSSKPSDSLMKVAPPNPSVAQVDPESETKPKEREMLSRVRDEGGLMIIESPGSEDTFAILEEATKNEPKESPSEAKTSAEDHGQSNPSDADMYTTRS